jgi:ABC-type nitrate/sulfonate/bicarbonate transport system permease component
VFAALFVIAVMGIVMYAIAAAFERRHTNWATRGLDNSQFGGG